MALAEWSRTSLITVGGSRALNQLETSCLDLVQVLIESVKNVVCLFWLATSYFGASIKAFISIHMLDVVRPVAP